MSTLIPPSTQSSQKGKQLAAVLFLRDFSCRLQDVQKELTNFLSLFVDQLILTRNQRSAIISIEKAIIPFISVSLPGLKNAAKLLAPIASCKYVHLSNERKRNAIVHNQLLCKKSLPLKLIENFNTKQPEVAKKKRGLCPDQKSVRLQILFATPNKPHPIFSPKNGTIYPP